jgi:DNA-3-methyladenine glycosylase I
VGVKIYGEGSVRCGWANPDDALYVAYHDEEWGVPEYDPRALWEKLVLDGFDPERVARYGEADRARLMADPGIVRSGAKIDAAIRGARIWLDMRERGEDFSAFLWDFVGGAPIHNGWTEIGEVPAQTPVAAEMARALKAKGFNFCGPVITYAFMQAVGMVNDHVTGCFRYDQVKALAGAHAHG